MRNIIQGVLLFPNIQRCCNHKQFFCNPHPPPLLCLPTPSSLSKYPIHSFHWRGAREKIPGTKVNQRGLRVYPCAARAFYDCPAIISHRPRSQNISKEPHLNPEKDSRKKRPRSHVSLEKSSQNYKPLDK